MTIWLCTVCTKQKIRLGQQRKSTWLVSPTKIRSPECRFFDDDCPAQKKTGLPAPITSSTETLRWCTRISRDGSIVSWDGSIVSWDGSMVSWDGSIVSRDGSIESFVHPPSMVTVGYFHTDGLLGGNLPCKWKKPSAPHKQITVNYPNGISKVYDTIPHAFTLTFASVLVQRWVSLVDHPPQYWVEMCHANGIIQVHHTKLPLEFTHMT